MNKKIQEGSILTVSIMFTAILTLLAAGLFALTLRSADEVQRLRYSMEAFFLAETGVNEMVSQLAEDYGNKDNPALYPSGNLGKGSYSVTVTQPGGRVLIESTGVVKGIQRKIYVEVEYEAGDAFDYGLFSNGSISISGSSNVIAECRTNGSVSVSGSGELDGDATAAGTVTTSGSGTVTGSTTNGADTVSFPTFNFNYYYNLATSGGLYYNGNQTFSSTTLSPGNGVIYVNGNVTLSGTSSLTGAIVATGSITVGGTFTQTQVGTYPSLMSRDSNITIGGNSTINGLIYTASGNVGITGSGTFNGQIITYGTTTFSGGSDVTLNETSQTPPGLSEDANPIKRISFHE